MLSIHRMGSLPQRMYTDASGLVKAMMDELYEYFFESKKPPNKVRLAVACVALTCAALFTAQT